MIIPPANYIDNALIHYDYLSICLQLFANYVPGIHVPFFPTADTLTGSGSCREVGVSELVSFYSLKRLSVTDRASLMTENSDKIRPRVRTSAAVAVYDGGAMDPHVAENGMIVDTHVGGNAGQEHGGYFQVYQDVTGWANVEAQVWSKPARILGRVFVIL